MPSYGSPRGIFVGLSESQLETLRTTALERITNGSFTSLGGAQKNSTVEYMDPGDILDEVQFALDKLNGTARPSVVNADFSGLRPMPSIT